MQSDKLSELQKEILREVYAHPGATWRGAIGDRGKSATDRADISRSLARLEARQLITRTRRRGRTVRVELTPDGQSVVEDLNGANMPSIEELQAQGEQYVKTMSDQLDARIKREMAGPLTPALRTKLNRLVWAVVLQRPEIYTRAPEIED